MQPCRKPSGRVFYNFRREDMVIPEFILRKLFVKGSLKKEGVGFSFSISNTFAPATLLSVGLDVDGNAIDTSKLAMGPEEGELTAAEKITPDNPLPLSVGVIYKIAASTSSGSGKLTIRIDTREAGEIIFTVQAGGKEESGSAKKRLKVPSFLLPSLKAHVTIDLDDELGEINPFVYGQFIEHLERCIYDGIWTKDGSALRTDTFNLISAIKPSVIRYPGGNFASGYHWEDGIGPKEKRPERFDEAWQSHETNLVGTDEYIKFCRMVGTVPFLVINDGNGTPEEAARWVAYCNEKADGQEGGRRAANGYTEPHNVKIWGAGNEVWGRWQIGHTGPAEYADRLRKFVSAMQEVDPEIHIVAVGDKVHTDSPDDPGYIWNRTVLEEAGDIIDSISFHIYQPENEGWRESYDRESLHKTVCAAPLSAERIIKRIAGQIRKYAPGSNIGITFDEWNLWLPPEPGASSMHNINYNMRDAVYCAGMLNVFHRQCKDLFMANLAQLVNVLPAIVTDESRAYATAIYYPFLMYTRMQKLSLGCRVESPSFGSEALGNIEALENVPWLDAVATRSYDERRLAIGLLNRHPSRGMKIGISLKNTGPGIHPVRISILSAESPLIENSFASPHAIKLEEKALNIKTDSFIIELPACSVAVLD
jgi:alpha-L-arabinofuranosidase